MAVGTVLHTKTACGDFPSLLEIWEDLRTLQRDCRSHSCEKAARRIENGHFTPCDEATMCPKNREIEKVGHLVKCDWALRPHCSAVSVMYPVPYDAFAKVMLSCKSCTMTPYQGSCCSSCKVCHDSSYGDIRFQIERVSCSLLHYNLFHTTLLQSLPL